MAAQKKRKLHLPSSSFCASQVLAVLQETPSCISTLQSLHNVLLAGNQEAEYFGEELVRRGFLQLIPSLLRQPSKKRVTLSIELLGALSMGSFTTHCRIVEDKDTVSALSQIFESKDHDLLTSACHTVVDLLITPVGRERLRESAILEHLLRPLYLQSRVLVKFLNDTRGRRLLCWIADLSKEIEQCYPSKRDQYSSCEPVAGRFGPQKLREILVISHLNDDETGKSLGSKSVETSRLVIQDIPFCKDFHELVATALMAVDLLLRNNGIERIPPELLHNVLKILRKHWQTLQRNDQILLLSTDSDINSQSTCNRRIWHLVARCVVQLAMAENPFGFCKVSVRQTLFENTDLSMEIFLEKYWEQAPLLIGSELPPCLLAFSKSFSSLAALVNGFFAWFVACPPASADQVDSPQLFEDLESLIGEPMIYGQDVRFVKTVPQEHDKLSSPTQSGNSEVEMYFCAKGVTFDDYGGRHVHAPDILEAVENGYTVAIKGIELRCPDIAEMADCLARQCGLPSVGVNLYLTPPNAQGLKLHSDDHCVFVYQLFGCKTWNVFQPQQLLPRLYACRSLDYGVLTSSQSTLFTLEKGNILYIPRGFPHKAHSGSRQQKAYSTSLPSSEGLSSDRKDGAAIRGSTFSRFSCENTSQRGPSDISGSGNQRDRVDGMEISGDNMDNPESIGFEAEDHSCFSGTRDICVSGDQADQVDDSCASGDQADQVDDGCASGDQANKVDDMHMYGDNASRERCEGIDFQDQARNRSSGSLVDGFYSLHLTFGIEVEPPFEWEGLVHIALRLWTQQCQQIRPTTHWHSGLTQKSDHKTEQLCEALFHIAIKILGEKEVLLRKACTIEASTVDPKHSRLQVEEQSSASLAQCGTLSCKTCDSASVMYFQTLLGLVVNKASYHEAYSFAQAAEDSTNVSTGGMEWFRHIPCPDGESITAVTEPLSLVINMIKSNELQHSSILEAEATFEKMKTEFGNALMFHCASKAFRIVWSKYRSVRTKFKNGMLALHDNCRLA